MTKKYYELKTLLLEEEIKILKKTIKKQNKDSENSSGNYEYLVKTSQKDMNYKNYEIDSLKKQIESLSKDNKLLKSKLFHLNRKSNTNKNKAFNALYKSKGDK